MLCGGREGFREDNIPEFLVRCDLIMICFKGLIGDLVIKLFSHLLGHSF